MSLVDFTVGEQAGVSIIPLPSRGVRDAEVMNIFRQRFKLTDLDAAGLAAVTGERRIPRASGHAASLSPVGQEKTRGMQGFLGQACFFG
jgi:hypothetical protein